MIKPSTAEHVQSDYTNNSVLYQQYLDLRSPEQSNYIDDPQIHSIGNQVFIRDEATHHKSNPDYGHDLQYKNKVYRSVSQ